MLKFESYQHQKAELMHILVCYQHQNISSIEHYNCKNITNVSELPAATPLSIETANALFKNLQISKGVNLSFKSIIPSTVIYCNPNTQQLVWKIKPQIHTLLFDNDKFKSTKYPMPTLVFNLMETTLHVYATKTYRITENTPLFHAPFLNVWSNGKICMGSASINKIGVNYFEDLITLAQYQFFNSKFTHTNHNNIVNGNIIEVYKKIQNKTAFPIEILNNMNLKIKQLWKQ